MTWPVALELRHHRLHRIGRNVEADADRTAGRRVDRGVDADDVAFDVERRSAGIAFVDRRVDLQIVVIRSRADITAARGNDARGDGAAETERIADRDHPVADLRRALGELHEREVALAVDLDQRQIGFLIGADHLRRIDRAVVGRDLHRLGVIDHVVVGHRIAVGGDEEAGAFAGDGLMALRRLAALALLPLAALTLTAELVAELLEELVHRRAGHHRNGVLVVVALLLHRRRLGGSGNLHPHRDDGGFHLGDDIGEAGRMLHGRIGSARGRRPRRQIGVIATRAAHQQRGADSGDRGQQHEAPGREGFTIVRKHHGSPSRRAAQPPLPVHMGAAALRQPDGRINSSTDSFREMNWLPPGGGQRPNSRCDNRAAKGKFPMLDNMRRTLLVARP